MIKGITHVALRVSDIETSVDFYTNKLGLEERFRLIDGNGDLMLVYIDAGPGQFIELFPGGECSLSANPSCSVGPVHLCFEVDDIFCTYKELTEAGVETRGEPILGADKSWQFWTMDPDKCPIEFHQFTPDSLQFK